MKKTICIVLAAVLLAAAFVAIMLLTDSDEKLIQDPTETTKPIIEIDYYEDHMGEGTTNTSTAPSRTVKMESGKVIYTNGTEKSWLELYKEQESNPHSKKLFTFVSGTTLVNAFESNETISTIIIPEGIRELESCFNNNFVPCNITLPTTLENIKHTFENAQNLQLSTKEGSKIIVMDNVLYADAGETLLMYPAWNANTAYIMPNTVKKIAKEALVDNVYLTNITFSTSLETIEKRGVANCPNIISLRLPQSIQLIDSAFSHMYLLESINIPQECVLKGINFTQCPKLQLTIENTNDYVYEDDVLYNQNKTRLIRYMEIKQDVEFALPDTIQEIAPSAFAYNTHLQTLILNEGLEEVGTYFAECTNLKTVNLPVSIKTIKTMSFTRLPQLNMINYAGTMEQWIAVDRGVDWIISSIEYKINCSDESISYKGAA